MSYILDALKKAEAERDPEARATFAIAEQNRRRNRTFAYAIIIALIVNAGVLLWLFLPDDLIEADSTEVAEVAPGVEEMETESTQVKVQPRVSPQPQPQPQPRTEPRLLPEDGSVAAGPGDTVVRPAGARDIPARPESLSSLPADVRNRFPSLNFSTHIYAEEADLRAVVVNGVRLVEGDRFEGLVVHEITEEGAVFKFENRLVAISVLDGWN